MSALREVLPPAAGGNGRHQAHSWEEQPTTAVENAPFSHLGRRRRVPFHDARTWTCANEKTKATHPSSNGVQPAIVSDARGADRPFAHALYTVDAGGDHSTRACRVRADGRPITSVTRPARWT